MNEKLTVEQMAQARVDLINKLGFEFPEGTPILDPHGNVTGVRLSEEASFTVSYTRNPRQMLHFSGNWPLSKLPKNRRNYQKMVVPRDLRPGEPSPSICVSAAKSVRQIAEEVRRRFLPAYFRVLAECIAQRDQNDASESQETNLAGRVAAALGQQCSEGRRNFDLPGNVTSDRGYGHVVVTGDDSVDFSIGYLKPDVALKLIELLKTL